MPHASEDGGAAGEDACSSDELIVFKDENGGEDVVKRSSDKVTEEKSDLIDLSESEVNIVNLPRMIRYLVISVINLVYLK
ncbi:protein pangolin, isoforms A/H/I/S isoform X6 [Aphis craccivora]|uniref:Protein pangolin, isoforms A/H/I/S isoform X6 n=1 Tax=Aphis craccivora TaxID=307492 RepID=A0A6G0ZCJ3_APHCR|nr:protein pangolin, isoforms A/H/I/S isoform X6 [Aphis craccivora]